MKAFVLFGFLLALLGLTDTAAVASKQAPALTPVADKRPIKPTAKKVSNCVYIVGQASTVALPGNDDLFCADI